AISAATLVLWILKGIWQPFIIGLFVTTALGIWVSYYYFTHTRYLCPECHNTFFPSFKEAFWAKHTPKTRKLHCPHCGHHGFCIELYNAKRRCNHA
ncbi:MAG: MerR family transcriptional regulator, partial [Agathobacter sp.]